MTVQAPADWWKHLFDEVYLMTDARSVCDPEVTRREVDLILSLLPMEPGHRVLDLCGGHGRHSLELCSRGFSGGTLVDYSGFLVEQGKKQAAEKGFDMDFHQADARDTGLEDQSFDHVMILGNSLGYIQQEGADQAILAEAWRLARPGASILVDVADVAGKVKKMAPAAWHEIGEDIVTCRQRSLQGRVAHVREVVLSKSRGLVRDQAYAIRYFEPEELSGLVQKAGFAEVEVRTDFSPFETREDRGFMESRMVVLGKKPRDLP